MNVVKRMTAVFLSAMMLLTLAACSGKPSTDEMSTLIEQNMEESFTSQTGLTDLFQVENLQKLDAREEDDGKKYIADLSFDLVANKSAAQVNQALSMKGYVIQMTLGEMLASVMGSREWEAGYKKTIKGTFTFAKTEKGWKLIQ